MARSVRRESSIQSEILAWLGSRPWCRAWRQVTGTYLTPDGRHVVRAGLIGSADISGILHDGRRLEVEVKSARGTQSKQQKAFEAMVKRMGGVYVVARSVDEVRAALELHGYRD